MFRRLCDETYEGLRYVKTCFRRAGNLARGSLESRGEGEYQVVRVEDLRR